MIAERVEVLSDLGLRGRVAIVSGGARGIGRACVRRLAEAGAHVVINYLRAERAAFEAEAEAQRAGAETLLVRADVSRVGEAERVVREARERFGRVEILVCNAGVWRGAAVEEMSEELWDEALNVNLKGTWTLTRAAVPEMKRAGAGRIVIVSSTAGQRGEAFYANYAASKGGQIALMKSLAAELAPHQINVNAVAPGWVETEMTEEVMKSHGARAAIERAIPLGRVAAADDIALPVLFLCSDWARHITGAVLSINGGAVL